MNETIILTKKKLGANAIPKIAYGTQLKRLYSGVKKECDLAAQKG